MSEQEHERKFLLDPGAGGPDLGAPVVVRQGYLALDGSVSVRVREADGELTLTIKGGTGRSRTEVERAIDRSAFESLWPLTEGRRIEKRRHRVPLDGGLVAEVDLYDGALAGLAVVEVELPSAEAVEAFEPPAWFGREVTDDARYANASLATLGRP